LAAPTADANLVASRGPALRASAIPNLTALRIIDERIKLNIAMSIILTCGGCSLLGKFHNSDSNHLRAIIHTNLIILVTYIAKCQMGPGGGAFHDVVNISSPGVVDEGGWPWFHKTATTTTSVDTTPRKKDTPVICCNRSATKKRRGFAEKAAQRKKLKWLRRKDAGKEGMAAWQRKI